MFVHDCFCCIILFLTRYPQRIVCFWCKQRACIGKKKTALQIEQLCIRWINTILTQLVSQQNSLENSLHEPYFKHLKKIIFLKKRSFFFCLSYINSNEKIRTACWVQSPLAWWPHKITAVPYHYNWWLLLLVFERRAWMNRFEKVHWWQRNT